MENEEDFQTEIWSFAYPLSEPTLCEDGVLREEIVVATTRPETMLGDTAGGSTSGRPTLPITDWKDNCVILLWIESPS